MYQSSVDIFLYSMYLLFYSVRCVFNVINYSFFSESKTWMKNSNFLELSHSDESAKRIWPLQLTLQSHTSHIRIDWTTNRARKCLALLCFPIQLIKISWNFLNQYAHFRQIHSHCNRMNQQSMKIMFKIIRISFAFKLENDQFWFGCNEKNMRISTPQRRKHFSCYFVSASQTESMNDFCFLFVYCTTIRDPFYSICWFFVSFRFDCFLLLWFSVMFDCVNHEFALTFVHLGSTFIHFRSIEHKIRVFYHQFITDLAAANTNNNGRIKKTKLKATFNEKTSAHSRQFAVLWQTCI